MSRMTVTTSGPLQGRVRVPGDKSISHRALLLGAIAEGTSRVENLLVGADCCATLGVIGALGIEVEQLAPTTVIVHGRGLRGLREPEDVLDCGRSGTTMRLLAGIMAGQPFLSVLGGDAQLRRRPMGRVAEPLRTMGAVVLGRDRGRFPPLVLQGPLSIRGQGHALRGIDYSLPVASAQVKSALLLAGLYADGPTTLHVPGPARDHTERMLLAMGGGLHIGGEEGETGKQRVQLEPGLPLQAIDVMVPGDLSSAAFLVIAALLVPGSEVFLEGVGVNPTRSGLLEVLKAMNADMTMHNERLVGGEAVADLTVRVSELRGIDVVGDLVVRMIDEFPILAVAATQAQGQTLVRDAGELRVKETDRIVTTVQELRRLGAQIEARPDGFLVQGPTPLHGAPVGSHGDHRLAMALAVAGLIASGDTTIEDVDCITDSFPGFEAALVDLGGCVR